MHATYKQVKLVKDFPKPKYKEYLWRATFKDGEVMEFVNTGQCIPDVKGKLSLKACYNLSMPYCVGKRVLDCASGPGGGSSHLTRVAKHVLGVEYDKRIVLYGQKRYGSNKCKIVRGDITDLGFTDDFDVAVCVDTIEHIVDWKLALRNLSNAVRNGGTIIITTPERKNPKGRPSNPYHFFEWTMKEFVRNVRFLGDVKKKVLKVSNAVIITVRK